MNVFENAQNAAFCLICCFNQEGFGTCFREALSIAAIPAMLRLNYLNVVLDSLAPPSGHQCLSQVLNLTSSSIGTAFTGDPYVYSGPP